jgi:hypothetical protein
MGLASYALFNIGFWAEEITRLQEGLAYLNSAGKADQKLAGWSDKLSSLMEFVPKMDSALWALIGISGGTTVLSSILKGGLTAPGQTRTGGGMEQRVTTATAPDSSHAIQRKTTDMVDRIADLNKRCSCAIRSYAQRPRAASDAVERP